MSNLHGLPYECNENAINPISPHLLTYVQEPRSPLDAFAINSVTVRLTLMRYSSKHIKGRERNYAELPNKISRGTSQRSGTFTTRRKPKRTSIREIMLKRNMVQYSLYAKYDGPFEVLERSGSDVKLQVAAKDRWAHLSNVRNSYTWDRHR